MLFCRRTPFICACVLASFLMLAFANPVSAETYQWTDKNGSVGFADSLEKVPPEYRKSAKRLQEDKSGKGFQTVPGAPDSDTAAPSEYSLSQDPDYWRERMLAAQEQLEQLKIERQQAQLAYDNLLGQRNQHSRPIDAKDVEQAASRLSAADRQLRDKEREISTMADEARRSGVSSSVLSP